MTGKDDSGTSFDPRAWATATVSPGVLPPRQTTQSRLRSLPPAALLATSALLLAAGPFLAWHDRVATPEAVAGTATVATPATPNAPQVTTSRRILNLASATELHDALLANGLAAGEADAITGAARGALTAPGEVRAAITIDGSGSAARLLRLEASFADSSGVVVQRAPAGGFVATRVAASLSTQVRVVRGEIDGNSFYTSAVAAGVTDSLIGDFAAAFVYDFNFQTEIGAGDVFEAAFEQRVNASGDAVGPPVLRYAAMTTKAKSKQVYRFQLPGKDTEWYDGNGASVKRSFMRTPVEGARITSVFGMRFHPILHYMKLHGGIDFAAPIGTPIYASAAGQVTWAQMKGCNGNLAIVRHDNGWETFYLHMLHYADGIAAGVRVRQGQQLGVVGTTGCSTGPHLHYEVHVGGEKVDPQSIKTDAGETLSGPALQAFVKERDRIDVVRAGYAG